jgi:hypothetical protein
MVATACGVSLAPGHGKGPHDGAGTGLKRSIWRAQLDAHGPKLQSAANVVHILHANLSARR